LILIVYMVLLRHVLAVMRHDDRIVW
jgi:hypothetical protein